MRIVSWNCNGKFREKFREIQKLNADIYVIQECENPVTTNNPEYNDFAKNYIWVGHSKNKGLGVFANKSIILQNNNWDSYCLKNFLSVRINNKFDLVAVWACKPYIEEYYIYQSIHIDKYNSNTILIGDFNSNQIWDNSYGDRNHSQTVSELNEAGLVSAYHYITGEKQGKEKQNTFYLYRHFDKGYHIDHCFINKSNIKTYKIENKEIWLSYSDHISIILETVI